MKFNKAIIDLIKASNAIEINKYANEKNEDNEENLLINTESEPYSIPSVEKKFSRPEKLKQEIKRQFEERVETERDPYGSFLKGLLPKPPEPKPPEVKPLEVKKPLQTLERFDKLFLHYTTDYGTKGTISVKDIERLLSDMMENDNLKLQFVTAKDLAKEYILWLNDKYVSLITNNEYENNEKKQQEINISEEIKEKLLPELIHYLQIKEDFENSTEKIKFDQMLDDYLAIHLIRLLKDLKKPPAVEHKFILNLLQYSEEDIEMFDSIYTKKPKDLFLMIINWLKFKIIKNNENELIIKNELRNILKKYNVILTAKLEADILAIYEIGRAESIERFKTNIKKRKTQYQEEKQQSQKSSDKVSQIQEMIKAFEKGQEEKEEIIDTTQISNKMIEVLSKSTLNNFSDYKILLSNLKSILFKVLKNSDRNKVLINLETYIIKNYVDNTKSKILLKIVENLKTLKGLEI